VAHTLIRMYASHGHGQQLCHRVLSVACSGGLAQGERSPAFRIIIIAGRLEVPSVDEHMESTRARGEDLESHGCARHAPADRR
jgi:hypothetical protein